jgi:hypothetical protein
MSAVREARHGGCLRGNESWAPVVTGWSGVYGVNSVHHTPSFPHTFAGISVERQFGERFTGIGPAGHQHFTDGNDREYLRAA